MSDCQHLQIDSDTNSCVECGEAMECCRVNTRTIVSDRDPDTGYYIPGSGFVYLVGFDYDYTCQNCHRLGVISECEPIVNCGGIHRCSVQATPRVVGRRFGRG